MAGEVLDTNQDGLPEDSNSPVLAPGGNFFEEIMNDPQKRLYAIIAAAVVVVLIIASIAFMGKQDQQNKGKPVALVQELDQSRAFEIVAKLKSVNIEAKVGPSDKPGEYIVTVYENAIETAYLALSRTNLLEDDGYGLFDSNDWAASDYDKRIKLIRAINGDLSRIISRLDGLRSAIVRVNIPEQQLFSNSESSTTATVQIELANDGDEISKAQVKSIVNILRGYVQELSKDSISIVDTQGRNYSTFKNAEEEGSEDYIEEVERVNKMIAKRIEKYLDVVVGQEKYKVSVSAKVSRERIEKQATTYSDGAVSSRQANNEVLNSGSGSRSAGPGGPGGKNYKNDSKTETLFPSYEQQQVTYLPGRVTDVTVALAVDKSIPATMSLKQLQESVAAIVGPSTNANNIKLTVVDLYGADDDVKVVTPDKPGFFVGFFNGGFLSVLGKILTVVGVLFLLFIAAIIGLNVIGAAMRPGVDTEIDPSLGDEFDEVLTESHSDLHGDFGEQESMEQQEALLKEMLSNDAAEAEGADKEAAKSYSAAGQEVEFDTLLNGFQSAASSQPDILAKKIQVWLDDE